MGNELTPTQVKDEPSVSWPADPNSFYTLCMTGNIFMFKMCPCLFNNKLKTMY